MNRAPRIAVTVAAAGLTATGIGAVAAPSAAAAPTTTLCSFTYPNPNLPLIWAESTASAIPTAPGKVTLRLTTDSRSFIGYSQQFRVTWANLDTGFSGVANTTARVVGSETILSIPDVATASGRVALVLGAMSTGTLNPNSVSTEDCSAEYTVP
ncbi:hypothetical protein VZC37_00585 [Gordonia sp. LSe1-13]|uniref:Secreted protein n=1 Tax=Gordonia sesuvii TaxID=3116777 RepID=A0ABU7M6T4_9ACTN|nr:hypothetical protein [Gordonia sp. LSe1-13]